MPTIKKVKRWRKDLSEEQSLAFEVELEGRAEPAILKVAGSYKENPTEQLQAKKKTITHNLRGLISNNIAFLEHLHERGVDKTLGLGYLGSTEFEDRKGVLFEFIPSKYSNLESRLGTNLREVVNNEEWDKKKEKDRREGKEEVKNYHAIELWARNTFSFQDAVGLFRGLLWNLEILHDNEGIHGDVWPGNIRFFQGQSLEVMLIDHALARRKGGDPKELFNEMIRGASGVVYSTNINDILCNKVYHPPEFDTKLPEDYSSNETSDIYNACNVLCLTLTGRLIEFYKDEFKGGNLEEFLRNRLENIILDKNPALESEPGKKEVRKIVNIIVTGTRRDYKKRFQNVREINDEFDDKGVYSPPELPKVIVAEEFSKPRETHTPPPATGTASSPPPAPTPSSSGYTPPTPPPPPAAPSPAATPVTATYSCLPPTTSTVAPSGEAGEATRVKDGPAPVTAPTTTSTPSGPAVGEAIKVGENQAPTTGSRKKYLSAAALALGVGVLGGSIVYGIRHYILNRPGPEVRTEENGSIDRKLLPPAGKVPPDYHTTPAIIQSRKTVFDHRGEGGRIEFDDALSDYQEEGVELSRREARAAKIADYASNTPSHGDFMERLRTDKDLDLGKKIMKAVIKQDLK